MINIQPVGAIRETVAVGRDPLKGSTVPSSGETASRAFPRFKELSNPKGESPLHYIANGLLQYL